MSQVLEVIENKDLDLTSKQCYAAILGESPSKGAKSPVLWNAAFDALNISSVMKPMDVSAQNLKSVVECLKADEHYIGGAVTMPYKVDIIPYLDEIEDEAKVIGAVNCIYRNNGKLVGSNTDGAGALVTLEESYGSIKGKKVLAIGTGGAGLAVASYLAKGLGPEGTLYLANRSSQTRDDIAKRLEGKCKIQNINEWPVPSHLGQEVDIVVNSTSIGFETIKTDKQGAYCLKYYTPLGEVDSSLRVADNDQAEREYLRISSESTARNIDQALRFLTEAEDLFVFDIIYQPLETMLMSLANFRGFKTLNGLPMNLEQAVIAFEKATQSSKLYEGDVSKIREAMERAR